MLNYFCGRHASVYLIPNCDDYLYIVLLSTPKTWIPVRVTMIDHPPSPPQQSLTSWATLGSYLFPPVHVLLARTGCLLPQLPTWRGAGVPLRTTPASRSQLEQVLWNKLDCLLEHNAAA